MTRTFKMIRDEDVSGVSGIGLVAEGSLFSNGHVALSWVNTPYPTTTVHPGGLESVMYVHGHGGRTRIVWDDDQPAPSFGEDDIAFLHTILSMPDDDLESLHSGARELLRKLRSAMTLKAAT